MKPHSIAIFLASILILLAIACSNSSPTAVPTPDNQAIVNAAIVATTAAQTAMQATIDTAIDATSTSLAAQVTLTQPAPAQPAAPATQAVLPTVVVIPTTTVEYVEMTEEELEKLIEQSVDTALAASIQASTATTSATSDDAMTSEEVQTVQVYISGAEQAIAYTEQLISAYYELYGDLTSETISYLTQVEQDLAQMAADMQTIYSSLEAINSSLQQGLALATETINQVETTAQSVNSNITETQTQIQTWVDQAQAQRETRVQAALAVQPDAIAADEISAIISVFEFVDEVKNSINDNKITRDELTRISQLSANASAGLTKFGGVKFQGFAGKISEITGQIARGQMPQARSGIGSFESSLGARPQIPGKFNLPGGANPGLPNIRKP